MQMLPISRHFKIGIAIVSAIVVSFASQPVARAQDTPVRVLIWDEQQPKQQPAYDNFLGNAIADSLKSRL
jgi:hypothetical protein